MNSISAVILVGGVGSRFSAINEPPKQLSKLNKNIILINIMNNFKRFGLNHFIFPLGSKKSFFIKFFNDQKNIKKYNSLLRKIVHEHISTINPETILLLGSFALQTLFGEEYSIAKNRGQWLSYSAANNSINIIPSFHPTFLLKQPSQKKKSWEDLQKLQKKLNNA